MCPVSRRRKSKKQQKQSTRQSASLSTVDPGGPCDCPQCSGLEPEFDPQQLTESLLQGAAALVDYEDPLEGELLGAAMLSTGPVDHPEFAGVISGLLVPSIEADGSATSLAMLQAIGSIAPDQIRKATAAAAERLIAEGIPQPGWRTELDCPVVVGECWRMSDPDNGETVLATSFHRAGRSHAVIVTLDEQYCGAARNIYLIDAISLPESLQLLHESGRKVGVEITKEQLDPAEFRWQIENALGARAVHDLDDLDSLDDEPDDEDGPPYQVMALLLRERMNSLPVPGKPAAPHPAEGAATTLASLAQLFGSGRRLPGRPDRAVAAALPPKRKKSDGPAPIYQLKVGLRGAKPPIWRRLEVPADLRLDELHAVIQLAFDWDDSHLHVFETSYGRFGLADAELGQKAEHKVTLEQVAPKVKAKVRYTYDFGDDWEHDIEVEKILDPDESVRYPRCTGGRRSPPPEDCGGIWGYAFLLDVLADPDHPEHEDRLDWMGFESANDLPADKFDAETVTIALSTLR